MTGQEIDKASDFSSPMTAISGWMKLSPPL
jgi:hypothetical protein